MRVAVAQFGVGADVDRNLAACLGALDDAARLRPDLVVLPEFCNHASWYEDPAHCYAVSLAIDGPFLQAVAAKVRAIKAHVVINCTLRREEGQCTGTSLLYGPDGALLGTNDKQVLIGHENEFLRKAQQPGPIVQTALGRLGLYACMDGVIFETPRCLALRGAQLLCNSLNSFASDEGSLHVPVRAAESKVFVAAANKVGPLIPEAILEQASRQTGIPMRFLMGAGESQIVAPDGEVLAKASKDREEVVCADIDVLAADRKDRPDGSSLFAWRRPKLYAALAEDPAGQQQSYGGAESVRCALVQLAATGAEAVAEATARVAEALADGAQLVALPPLFFLPGQQISAPEAAAEASAKVIDQLAAQCGAGRYVATTLVAGNPPRLCAALIGAKQLQLHTDGGVDAAAEQPATAPDGLFRDGRRHRSEAHPLGVASKEEDGLALLQGPLHRSERYAWSPLAERVEVADLGFARVAVLTSDDACIPEAFRLAALAGADTVVVPALPLERWEMHTGLLERSAENRVNLLASVQPGEFGASFATALTEDFTVRTPWKTRPFDGLLSQPPVLRASAEPGVTVLEIHPRWAGNKVVSRGTDLLAGRPWRLLDPICADEGREQP